MEKIEIEAKSVEEATILAAEQLCCTPESLDIEVVEEKKGFLGMGKRVKILAATGGNGGSVSYSVPGTQRAESHPAPVDPDHEPPAVGDNDQIPSWAMDPSFDPRESLEQICNMILPETNVERQDLDDRIRLDIGGDGSGIFIGRKGQTLDALQFIINKMYLKQTGRADHIIVDSEGYVERRISKLRDKALYLADKAGDTQRPQTTEPLNAHDRRIIHTTLRNHRGISTRSIGDGDFKRVQIAIRRREH